MKIFTLKELLEDTSAIGACVREFLSGKELDGLRAGKYPLSDGCTVSVSEYDTSEGDYYEAHKVFVDVQLLASGREEIRVAPIGKGRERAPYDEEKDITFYDVECAPKRVYLSPMQAVVLYPEDLHAPNNGTPVSHNKKLVFKVPVEKL